MDRRRFNHFFEELSLALDALAPRYALWLRMDELGLRPDGLSRADAERFCRLHLSDFVNEHGLRLTTRRRRHLERVVARFDPTHPTPYEHMARLGEPIRRP